jgi:thioredoxin-dependent peroxiredoxin
MRHVATATLLLAAAVPTAGIGTLLHAQTGAPKRSGSPTAVLQSGPDVGRRAPDFSLPWASTEGVGPAESPYQLWGDLGKTVVLIFYSRAFTKSSTATMEAFANQYEKLFGPDVVVLGISTDPPETQSRFAAQLKLPFRLLSDEGQKAAKKYGSYDSSGFIRRSVYVIGPDGKVRYRDRRFDPFDAKSYSAVGAAVKSAQSAPQKSS